MMTRNIKDILATYDFILENKKVVFGEADISGIDELVYNPATKSGGSIGHGYDGGKKVSGITWNNHDNHLHIGFTNRDVAMAVIDKADQLGLKTTENPYAKKDPNGKVDNVHTSGSFHYKVFPGEPKVGAGVDISGNPNTITELIKWVETTYAGGSYPEQKTVDYVESGTTSTSSTSTDGASSNASRYSSGDPLISDVAGKIIGNKLGFTETVKKSVVKEASASSTSLFGGTSVKIPSAGAHAGQSGWQSSNAWDIKAPVGTPVYALADGVAQTFSDYGKDVVKTQGKKLYGQSFTVKSDGGLPDVYYTHLSDSPIRKGSKIQCGQFLGYIMDFPGSSYDHVHIGVSSGHKIEEFLNSDGTLKCGGGGIIGQAPESSSSTSSTSSISPTSSTSTLTKSKDYSSGDPIISTVFGKLMDKAFGLNENSSKDSSFYLTFCNVSDLMNLRNGQKVSQGQIIGKTNTDVKVMKLDDLFNKSNINKGDFNLGKNVVYSFGEAVIPSNDNSRIKSPISGIVNNARFVNCRNSLTIEFKKEENNKEPKYRSRVGSSDYADPLVGNVLAAPFKLFQDKYDEKGELKQKRWGHTGEKVDPWIVDTLSAPFKKIGKIFKEGEEKKINENIDRIKKLIK